MPQLLFVDACVRGAESRSRMLAERFLSSYAAANPDAAILRRDLMRDRLEPQYPEVLACRDALAAAGKLDDPLFADAWQFARADRIVLAAPFWELSFPAILKIYLERVSMRDITFGYEEGQTVLKDVDLHVKAGESIALVGPTGAGKSTIVNLLCRFYDLRSGSITLTDESGVKHDITDVTLHSLRSQMGIMLQDSFIFSGTILDNIRYGRLDATDDEVRQAAAVVRADDFIREMPQGYKTTVNERGGSLSQGQKQLIAFARTLLSDPRILILDEATSSIDTKTEKLLQDGIQALLKGRTSFIIAHRLSTIKNCDRILYIGNQGIMEAGSHDELMAKRGAYYELYTAQARDQGMGE